jgi:hypothetical protein
VGGHLRHYLVARAAKDFDIRCDTAIVMVLIDGGPGLGELVAARY